MCTRPNTAAQPSYSTSGASIGPLVDETTENDRNRRASPTVEVFNGLRPIYATASVRSDSDRGSVPPSLDEVHHPFLADLPPARIRALDAHGRAIRASLIPARRRRVA
jgi:hypothetical protein